MAPPSLEDLRFERNIQEFAAATRGLFPPFMCCTRGVPPIPDHVAREPVGSAVLQTPAAGRQPFDPDRAERRA